MDKLKYIIQKQLGRMDVDEPNASTWSRISGRLMAAAQADLLKQHIAENKNDLQVELPPMALWENIKSAKAGSPVFVLRIKKRMLYLSAACLIIIASLGIVRYASTGKAGPNSEVVQTNSGNNDTVNATILTPPVIKLSATPSLPTKNIKAATGENSTTVLTSIPRKKQKKNAVPPVVREIEKDYNELIAAQIKYTKSLAIYGESAGYFEQFRNDFKLLDKQEKELRMSIAQKGLQEHSVSDLAMIYQEKLTVLKKLQNEINKTSARNKNITDTVPAYINL